MYTIFLAIAFFRNTFFIEQNLILLYYAVSKTIIYEKNTTIKNRTIYLREIEYVAIITLKYVKKHIFR